MLMPMRTNPSGVSPLAEYPPAGVPPAGVPPAGVPPAACLRCQFAGGVPPLSIRGVAHLRSLGFCLGESVSAIVNLPVGMGMNISRAALMSRSAVGKSWWTKYFKVKKSDPKFAH